MEVFFVIILGFIWFFSLIWVWGDASDKRGDNIGCLWLLVVFILGPIGLIAYLFVRKSD